MFFIIIIDSKENTRIEQKKYNNSIAFQTSSPNVLKIKFALAGLLTYSTFSAFPFQIIRNSGIAVKKLFY